MTYHKSKTSLDISDAWYPCYTDGTTWNGWMAAPYFDRETVMQVMADLCMAGDLCEWVGDVIRYKGAEDQLTKEFSRIEMLVDGAYIDVWCLGGWSWCWHMPPEGV